jgi:hypothetical protein
MDEKEADQVCIMKLSEVHKYTPEMRFDILNGFISTETSSHVANVNIFFASCEETIS